MKIGITAGDINGISLEVIIKTLSDKRICEHCTPIVYVNSKVLVYHKNMTEVGSFNFETVKDARGAHKGKINVVSCFPDNVNIKLGEATKDGGDSAQKALDAAMSDYNNGLLKAIVTAPINKKAMQLAKFQYPGHTEFFTDKFDVSDSLMLMCNDDLRVGLVTNHLPIKDVAAAVTKQKVQKKLNILYNTLHEDFGIVKPKIAILGLNPHASDGGAIGSEDEEFIRPIVLEAKKKGRFVNGPYPADGFFGSGMHKKFDGILAMYHDQGLIPFKALSFGSGVNFTAGLPLVRTSPDHGTGYEIVGQNKADASSFRQALFTAIDVVRNRQEYKEDYSNPLRKGRKKKLENSVDEKLPLDKSAK